MTSGRAVDHTFWLTPCHASEPNVWYAGTSPQGLFRSEDGGDTWQPFSVINEDPQYRDLDGNGAGRHAGRPQTALHHRRSARSGPSLLRHVGGRRARVGRWGPDLLSIVQGLEVVEGFDPADPSFHDPHCVRLCPSNPDRLYQQNHCGIYRLDRPSVAWARIGKKMPKRVGDIGFPLVVHPRDADTAWVFPMDGQTVWPRTSPGGIPAAYVTRDGGKSWQRLDRGLPQSQAWWTVKRQAMTADAQDPVGLYFGTTSGELWMSRDEGGEWACIAQHLPEIYAVEVAVPAEDADSDESIDPDPLQSYTQGREVEANGATLAEVLADLDRQFPASVSA